MTATLNNSRCSDPLAVLRVAKHSRLKVVEKSLTTASKKCKTFTGTCKYQ